jgi:hypothetical protein
LQAEAKALRKGLLDCADVLHTGLQAQAMARHLQSLGGGDGKKVCI